MLYISLKHSKTEWTCRGRLEVGTIVRVKVNKEPDLEYWEKKDREGPENILA